MTALPVRVVCDMNHCGAYAVAYALNGLAFCADCVGQIDAQRAKHGFAPLQWRNMP